MAAAALAPVIALFMAMPVAGIFWIILRASFAQLELARPSVARWALY